MPSVSAKQARMMRAIAHGWHKPGGGGPSVKVAKDFVAADKGRKFRSGGSVNKEHCMKRGGKTKGRGGGLNPAMLAALAPPGGPPPGAGPMPMAGGVPPPGGGPPGMKRGGITTATKAGSERMIINKNASPEGAAKRGHTKGKIVHMARGGAVRGHGIESKGKTVGRFV